MSLSSKSLFKTRLFVVTNGIALYHLSETQQHAIHFELLLTLTYPNWHYLFVSVPHFRNWFAPNNKNKTENKGKMLKNKLIR